MKRLAELVSLILVVGLIFTVVNSSLWATGRGNAPPLTLVSGSAAAIPGRIWIDTDAACGATPRTDPDDCLAIVWLMMRGGNVIGISTSFGNAAGAVVAQTVNTLADAMVRQGLPLVPLIVGHAAPVSDMSDTISPGATALQAALEAGPLSILALGPLTNVAQALNGRPDLQANVTRLVAVMGHQPGHLFHPTEGRGSGAVWGHGPIFRDLNVSVDPGAVTAVLAMHLAVTLIPYDAATQTLITGADLGNLADQGPAMAGVSHTARDWLAFWKDDIGLSGFYPFDWVAAAYLVRPDLIDCAVTRARVAREWTFWMVPHKTLLVGRDGDTDAGVMYCPQTARRLHDVLIAQP